MSIVVETLEYCISPLSELVTSYIKLKVGNVNVMTYYILYNVSYFVPIKI